MAMPRLGPTCIRLRFFGLYIVREKCFVDCVCHVLRRRKTHPSSVKNDYAQRSSELTHPSNTRL